MTEAEWLEATDPTPMLEFLRGKASDRKSRLFLCGCFQRVTRTDGEFKNVLAVSERFADGLATDEERQAAFSTLPDDATGDWLPEANLLIRSEHHWWAGDGSREAAKCVGFISYPYQPLDWNEKGWRGAVCLERGRQTDLLRDVYGNPFRPVAVDPSWLTSTVVALATGIYQDRAFDRMPILADALMDAGCVNDELLNHCRQPGEHVKGCWVVDLVLGKS